MVSRITNITNITHYTVGFISGIAASWIIGQGHIQEPIPAPKPVSARQIQDDTRIYLTVQDSNRKDYFFVPTGSNTWASLDSIVESKRTASTNRLSEASK